MGIAIAWTRPPPATAIYYFGLVNGRFAEWSQSADPKSVQVTVKDWAGLALS